MSSRHMPPKKTLDTIRAHPRPTRAIDPVHTQRAHSTAVTGMPTKMRRLREKVAAVSRIAHGIHQRDLRRYLAGDERGPREHETRGPPYGHRRPLPPAVPSGRGVPADVSCRSGEDSVIPGT